MRVLAGLALCVLFLSGCTEKSGQTDVKKPGAVPESSAGKGGKVKTQTVPTD